MHRVGTQAAQRRQQNRERNLPFITPHGACLNEPLTRHQGQRFACKINVDRTLHHANRLGHRQRQPVTGVSDQLTRQSRFGMSTGLLTDRRRSGSRLKQD